MITSSYDLAMILWGVVFVLAFTFFIVGMNRVFRQEERRQDSLAAVAQPKELPPHSP